MIYCKGCILSVQYDSHLPAVFTVKEVPENRFLLLVVFNIVHEACLVR